MPERIIYAADGKEIALVTPPIADTTPPTTPTFTSATASSNAIQITWSASTDSGKSSLARYKVYRQVGNGASIPVGTVAAGTTQYTDAPLTSGIAYTYRVIAFANAQNHSAPSDPLTTSTISLDR